MVNYECTQCGTLVTVGFGEPSECDNCGSTEFERVGGSSSGLAGLDIDSFVRICVGLVVLNVILGFVGVVAGGGARAAGSMLVSVVVLGAVAWLASNRSRVGWILGFGLFGLAGLFGLLTVLGGVAGGGPLTVAIGGFYVLVSLAAVAALVGGIDDVW